MSPISFRKENLSAGGLKDDFDGITQKLVFCPWNYSSFNPETGLLVPTEKQIDHFVLAVRVNIKADDGDEVNEFVSAGSLEDFWPSKDGETPVPLDKWNPAKDPLDMVSGPFVVKAPNGKREMMAESNFTGQWVDYALKSGFPADGYDADVSAFEGIYGHWNRIDQKERTGLKGGVRKEGRRSQVLCLTEIKPAPKGTGATKAAKAATAAKAAASAAVATGATNGQVDEFTSRFNTAALEALQAAGAPLTFAALGKAVVKKFEGAEKAKALRLASNEGDALVAISPDVVVDTEAETVTYVGD